MIVDIHAHAWPYLGEEGPYGSLKERMLHLQRHSIWHTQGGRRLSDGKVEEKVTLYDGQGSGVDNMFEVNFRPGSCGRLLWTYGGEDYFLQWMPGTMVRLEVPPEMMLAHMDYVGVDKGVISRGHAYGYLNDYVADVVRKWPDRFVGACEVEAWRAYEEDQIRELRRCVEELGLSALHFDGTESFFRVNYQVRYDDERFVPFWEEVRRLGIPVMWDVRCRHRFGPEDYAEQLAILGRFARRFPEIPIIITHAFNMRFFPDRKLTLEALDFCRIPNIYLELLFPIMNGRIWEYPFKPVQEIMKVLYQEVGPHKMMWGSDMPAAERVCTYQQSLDYLRVHCDFVAPRDMDAILGENAVRLFRIP